MLTPEENLLLCRVEGVNMHFQLVKVRQCGGEQSRVTGMGVHRHMGAAGPTQAGNIAELFVQRRFATTKDDFFRLTGVCMQGVQYLADGVE